MIRGYLGNSPAQPYGLNRVDTIGVYPPTAWFIADTGLTMNGASNVSGWADQSGNGYHLANGTSSSQPTLQKYVINGHHALLFDGSDDSLQGTVNMSIPGGNTSCFMVAKWVSRSGEDTPVTIASGNGAGGRCRAIYTADNNFGMATWGYQVGSSLYLDMGGSYHFWGYCQTGQTVTMYKDTATATGTLGAMPGTPQGPMSIGGINITYVTNILIAEVFMYDRALQSYEVDNLMAYIRAKYLLW